MQSKKSYIPQVGIKAGLLTFLALVVFFLISHYFFVITILNIHFFYIPVLAAGIWGGIVRLRRKVNEGEFYLKGFAEGMYISFISVILFSVFLGFYLQYFNTDLLKSIRADRYYINGFSIFTILSIEGIAWGLIITLVIMDYFSSRKGDADKNSF